MTLVIPGLKTILLFFLLLFQLLAGQTEIILKTKLYDINDIKYISALEYAKTQNIHTIFYEEKEKLSLYLLSSLQERVNLTLSIS